MEHGWCPTNYPGRTPIQIVGHLLFSVIILAAGQTRTSNQILRKAVRVRPAHHVGHSSSASVSAETTFYWACHFRFSLARKFPFLEIEKPIAETQEAEDEMLPSPFGGIPAAGRRVALPGARLEGIKLRINRPSRWVNRWQVRGFGVAAPIRWADHTGGRSPSRAANAHRLRL